MDQFTQFWVSLFLFVLLLIWLAGMIQRLLQLPEGPVNLIRYNIAKQFSPDPRGRHYPDDPNCGEALRETVLVPLLGDYDVIVVEFSGVTSISHAFLDEAFGGLVRYGYFQPEELLKRLQFHCGSEDEDYDECMFHSGKAWECIHRARFDSAQYDSSFKQ